MRALNIAATGMAAQNMRVEVISHNLANMSTTAYNARRAEFSDLHYQQIQRPGTINSADGAVLPAGVQLGLGVRAAAVSMQVAQGTVTETGGSLDLAIEGQGYLEVTLPSGEPAYTRDGALKRDGDGLIVTSDGYTVVPDITIPEDARQISINADGEVYAYFDGQTEAQLLGQFNLVSFSNEKGLEALGSNLYRETEASGQPNVGQPGEDGRGTFRQGYLESSSVDAVHEITGLIEAQRGYELNAKVITAADQMLAAMTQIR
ncbi:MAG: flagellar basal-body rod protein FlgG [Rhodobacteraceae bacterium]|uniref:flagellar basal-body rod protein FlgG n=1 Tax=Amaricoccus sp. TaxID=1872485 RepID=UPI001DBB0160|nr:flagellar basal-body rod protein FlgG [Amaricoccus sp.]MCB1371093.1 flagellar basal-body rod protein FlgG [Paracoccaceae bacterium]MCC0067271.1 flagellar basal-body rod protein FlgG [Rhodovulum sp.]MCB1373458.1 flagellar basal-body rod protein FlgG [Paracoccaceae bacterium]MCB1403522.1 flagellar basal-body rod protein FlgG [Paracoccaceae bacterium]HRW14936.1 flagellar basal-body rod protein FlgG [Amaricoccus sp.]